MSDRLTVSGLNVRLGDREVLHDVALDLEPGQVIGLIGPNGAGKSTLLRAMLGLIAATGQVAIGGTDLRSMGRFHRARRLSFLPQERDVAWPVSVEALVFLGRAPHVSSGARSSDEDRAAVDRAIAVMDLEELRHRSALELSGGERARALIARALAQETPCLLADEPTAGLDPAHQISLMATFSKLAADGRLVIASLHDLGLASQWCGRLILLHDGRVAADGPADQVLTPELLAEVYGITAEIVRTPHGAMVIPTGLVQTA